VYQGEKKGENLLQLERGKGMFGIERGETSRKTLELSSKIAIWAGTSETCNGHHTYQKEKVEVRNKGQKKGTET